MLPEPVLPPGSTHWKSLSPGRKFQTDMGFPPAAVNVPPVAVSRLELISLPSASRNVKTALDGLCSGAGPTYFITSRLAEAALPTTGVPVMGTGPAPFRARGAAASTAEGAVPLAGGIQAKPASCSSSG